MLKRLRKTHVYKSTQHRIHEYMYTQVTKKNKKQKKKKHPAHINMLCVSHPLRVYWHWANQSWCCFLVAQCPGWHTVVMVVSWKLNVHSTSYVYLAHSQYIDTGPTSLGYGCFLVAQHPSNMECVPQGQTCLLSYPLPVYWHWANQSWLCLFLGSSTPSNMQCVSQAQTSLLSHPLTIYWHWANQSWGWYLIWSFYIYKSNLKEDRTHGLDLCLRWWHNGSFKSTQENLQLHLDLNPF